MHERTEAACQWRTIWLPLRELHRYGLAMLGRSFEIVVVLAGGGLRAQHSIA